jgi:hypothetical protein
MHMINVSVPAARLPRHGLNPSAVVVWRYSFSRDCLQPMQCEIFANATQLPAYDRVLAMDEKVRAYKLPELFQSDAPIPHTHHAQSSMILFQRAILAMLIHGCAAYVACV